MAARTLVAMLVGLGLPMGLFIGVLELARPAHVDQDLIVERVEGSAGVPAVSLTFTQLDSLPDVLRSAFAAAIHDGAASIRLDPSSEVALVRLVGPAASATKLWVEIGRSVLSLEIRPVSERSVVEAAFDHLTMAAERLVR